MEPDGEGNVWEPTGTVRYLNGILQQEWKLRVLGWPRSRIATEWRDVPHE